MAEFFSVFFGLVKQILSKEFTDHNSRAHRNTLADTGYKLLCYGRDGCSCSGIGSQVSHDQ